MVKKKWASWIAGILVLVSVSGLTYIYLLKQSQTNVSHYLAYFKSWVSEHKHQIQKKNGGSETIG